MASTATEITVQLVPLCRFTARLEPPIILENTPSGTRYIIGASSARVEGERLKATLKGKAAGDWLTVSLSGIATLDVRATLETDDGALIFAHYNGRADMTPGPGNAPIFIAPLFETGDPRYAWLAKIQAVGKGVISADMSDLGLRDLRSALTAAQRSAAMPAALLRTRPRRRLCDNRE